MTASDIVILRDGYITAYSKLTGAVCTAYRKIVSYKDIIIRCNTKHALTKRIGERYVVVIGIRACQQILGTCCGFSCRRKRYRL